MLAYSCAGITSTLSPFCTSPDSIRPAIEKDEPWPLNISWTQIRNGFSINLTGGWNFSVSKNRHWCMGYGMTHRTPVYQTLMYRTPMYVHRCTVHRCTVHWCTVHWCFIKACPHYLLQISLAIIPALLLVVVGRWTTLQAKYIVHLLITWKIHCTASIYWF